MRGYRAFSHDVTAAILVFQNNEAAAMLVYQENAVGVELFSYVNNFFCSREWKCSIGHVWKGWGRRWIPSCRFFFFDQSVVLSTLVSVNYVYRFAEFFRRRLNVLQLLHHSDSFQNRTNRCHIFPVVQCLWLVCSLNGIELVFRVFLSERCSALSAKWFYFSFWNF